MSKESNVLAQAKQLHSLGMAIHWLHPKSKRPIGNDWTKGPRKSWEELESSYREGMNVGVRLGRASKIKGNFLAVIDVDVKSKDAKHGKEVEGLLKSLTGPNTLPEVTSGRGNGSRHYYILTDSPVVPRKVQTSKELVQVHMPSVKPSKRELERLSKKQLDSGIRLRPAWEIAVMGEGQQVVLPPSIHPDSGRSYQWRHAFNSKQAKAFDAQALEEAGPAVVDNSGDNSEIEIKPGPKTLEGFEVCPVDLGWLPVSDKIREMILTGEGVEDRSAMLLPISAALLKSGLTQNEVLTVLTDPDNYIGQTGYHHAKTSNRQKAAAWVYKYSLRKAQHDNSAEKMFEAPIEKAKPLTKEQIRASELEYEELHHWKLDLDTTKDDKIRGTLFNTVMILEKEVSAELVRRDMFAFRDFYSIDTPWGGEQDASVTDDDITKIKLWLGKNFGVEPNNNIIGEALTILATNNAFDPLVEWLESLPAWDETPRLDTWLKDNFGAKGDEEYLAQVFRKWMCAMVMRIYQPGSKFDWMPIFEGAQGVGKSSFGRLLCGEKYFLDWLPDLANKDSALALQGIWSVEMGELASFRKNEIETVKAFITRTVDKVRPPYGERWLEVRRRCVFFGTTNFETYLRDESGNRRFKPVKVGRLNFDELEADRDQLFAEAVWLYRHGFETEKTLDIQGDAKDYELSIQNEKMVSDESALMLEKLNDFVESEMKLPKAERFNFSKFKMHDLFEGTGPLRNWKYDMRNVQFAGKALNSRKAANWKSDGNKYWKMPLNTTTGIC